MKRNSAVENPMLDRRCIQSDICSMGVYDFSSISCLRTCDKPVIHDDKLIIGRIDGKIQSWQD